MSQFKKRQNLAAKELRRRTRLTLSDLAEAASRGERRLRADEMVRLGKDLGAHLVQRGFARMVPETSIIEWVPPMT